MRHPRYVAEMLIPRTRRMLGRDHEGGQTLIEVALVVAVVSIVLVGLVAEMTVPFMETVLADAQAGLDLLFG